MITKTKMFFAITFLRYCITLSPTSFFAICKIDITYTQDNATDTV